MASSIKLKNNAPAFWPTGTKVEKAVGQTQFSSRHEKSGLGTGLSSTMQKVKQGLTPVVA